LKLNSARVPPWLPPLRPLLDPGSDHLLRGSGRRARSSSPRRRADLYTAVHTRSSCPRFRAELSCGRSRAAPARTAGRISHGRSRARLLPTAPSRALPQPGLLPGPLDQMDSKGKPKSKISWPRSLHQRFKSPFLLLDFSDPFIGDAA